MIVQLATFLPAHAQSIWTGTMSSDWFAGANWQSGSAPTPAASAFIDTIVPNPTVVNAPGALALDVIVGGSFTGAMTIGSGGTLANSEGNVGYASGSMGTVTVSGAGTSWTNSGDLYIGRNGTGTLNISGGGQVSNAVGRVGGCAGCSTSAVGTVTVSGAGTVWTNSTGLAIGDSGTGQVTVSGGGQVLTGSAGGFLGDRPGSTGTMTVTDAGSAWTISGQLVVGGFLGPASGTLAVENGGTVTNTIGTIGYSSGSTGAVSVVGAGSTWTNLGNVSVGRAGTGALTIGSGGIVNVAGGTGTIVVADQAGSTGALNIGAAPGSTAVAPGTLNAAAVQFGAGTGALNFDHTASGYVFAPTISGAGTVNVLAGTTILAGANTYTGNTTVSGGGLVVNGSLASAVIVNGGALGGIGTVGATTVNSGGTLGVGSIGMLTVGSLVQNAGSTFQVMANPSAASLVTVTGTATLNGGTVSVLAQAGAWQRKTSYTILSAASRTGTFDGVTSNFAFLTPSLSYSSNAVMLTLLSSANSFQNGAQTPNQRAVGAALDRANSTASGDFDTVLNALYGLDTTQGPRALDAIAGQVYSGFASLEVQSTLLFMDSIQVQAGGSIARDSASLPGRGSYLLLKADDCDNACDAESLWRAWGGGMGAFGTMAGDSNSHGLTYNLGGFIAGLDRGFAPGLRAGIAAGFSAASLYAQGVPGTGTSNTLQFALYGEYQQDAFYLDGLAGYGHSDNRMNRPIVIAGLPFRMAQGYTTANTFFGQLETGYKIPIAPSFGGFVTPFARLQASTSTQAGFSETGADSLNLTVAQQTTNSLRTTLGAQLGASVDAPWREKLDLVLRLGWSHEFADTTRPVTTAFAGAPALSFTTFGAQAPRDGVVLGLGANTQIAERTSVYLRYDGEFADPNSYHIVSAGIRYVW
jgi:outer membrane autotransporter protein